ncbi:MAG TPA: NADP-dependent isocitrate dehydrogenase [Oligoflexus sp.]|uniref:NADP-dependent isocitrate dehydrogenase n=1 Tax=Oligoflexus sp. TaxID=1971216 RepID=UPI002D7FEFC0|nr:NADP-dependent isocitrate dehydrogenase [Oligoflexus sp.]HET9238238.1 NADP-dependent isocitrate dehydrogenase [Oligoflexus sp.]
MQKPKPPYKVTVIPGDGIGPEVTAVTRRLLEAVGAPIIWQEAEAGAKVFRKGIPSGVPQETIDSILDTGLVLKGPLETPVGYGEKSANVTLRKSFETFGNIRPIRIIPGVPTPYYGRNIDLVVVRENVEDLYAGIEHMQTPNVAQCLKLMSRKGCEKIVRLAFEVARAEGRTKVHCATKANIMKLTEGLLKRTFEEIASEYPDITAQHIIVDNCAHQLVRFPEQFEVIVTSNMNGDILSDLTSGLVGGLGFAPSANIGRDVAIFEAVHGSAPSIAGKNLANPSAHVLSGVMLLRHLGLFAEAERLENALLYTWGSGAAATSDVAPLHEAVGTSVFAELVESNLATAPGRTQTRPYRPWDMGRVYSCDKQPAKRQDVGVDVFIESTAPLQEIGRELERCAQGLPLTLTMISNRGTKVYPDAVAMPDLVDHHRCRFNRKAGAPMPQDADVLELLRRISTIFRWMHCERLLEVEDKPAFTKAQGEN